MKYGCINFSSMCIAIATLFILFFSIAINANGTENNLFEKALRDEDGKIMGYEQRNNLFFFEIVDKENNCEILLRNVMIEKRTCNAHYPMKKYPYKVNICTYKNNYHNMFDAKAFYYQFDEYENIHQEVGNFVRFDENYASIKECHFR